MIIYIRGNNLLNKPVQSGGGGVDADLPQRSKNSVLYQWTDAFTSVSGANINDNLVYLA